MYEKSFPKGAPRKVRALLFDAEENLVLLRRTKPNKPVYHVTAGGKIEPGERKVAALRRELREELDATVRVGRLFFTVLDTTYYVAALMHLGPNPFTGPEFAKAKNGKYHIDAVALHAVLSGQVDLQPEILPDLLRRYGQALLVEAAALR